MNRTALTGVVICIFLLTTISLHSPPSSAARLQSGSEKPSRFITGRERVSVKISEELSPAENWILTQVGLGEAADLNSHFPNEADRVITGVFIGRMLLAGTTGVEVQAYGIHIYNARVVGPFSVVNREILYEVSLSNCVFEDEVYLRGASFGKGLNLDGSIFNKLVDFRFLATGSSLSVNRSVFNGSADFYRMRISNNLEADSTQFNETRKGADLEGVTTGGYLILDHAIFNGPARFYRVNVEDNLQADDARFKKSDKPIIFQNMRIGGHALFRRSVFEGPVSFSSTAVGGTFETGTTEAGAHFKEKADFSNLTADSVGFHKTEFSGSLLVGGMEYRRISTGFPDDLLIMLSRSDYNSSAYTELEQYCNRIGNLEKADEVYIQRRRRERSNLSLAPKFGNLLLDCLVGYGRRPWRTLIWTVLIVSGAAALVFKQGDMEPKDKKDESRRYSSFLYSLDLLLPIVDLQTASVWRPKAESKFARRYLPIHVIAGWILGTILAGALTGVLK
jgi:hypothetical protein